MNIYRYEFKKSCPNNGLIISYRLTIETSETIMVEAIIAACMSQPSVYHERLADLIYERIGAGRHTISAFHHGVWIETRRGFE